MSVENIGADGLHPNVMARTHPRTRPQSSRSTRTAKGKSEFKQQRSKSSAGSAQRSKLRRAT
jgi:hypothetical protein